MTTTELKAAKDGGDKSDFLPVDRRGRAARAENEIEVDPRTDPQNDWPGHCVARGGEKRVMDPSTRDPTGQERTRKCKSLRALQKGGLKKQRQNKFRQLPGGKGNRSWRDLLREKIGPAK
jgi:hypothetical protein